MTWRARVQRHTLTAHGIGTRRLRYTKLSNNASLQTVATIATIQNRSAEEADGLSVPVSLLFAGTF